MMQPLKKYPAADMAPTLRAMRNALLLVAMLALPELVFAQDPGGGGGGSGGTVADFQDEACTFLDNIVNLLGIASIAVVTIAIVFAGYQIAFAHKRISDVAPILIGGLLIGGAGQLAGWILQDEDRSCDAGLTMLQHATQYIT